MSLDSVPGTFVAGLDDQVRDRAGHVVSEKECEMSASDVRSGTIHLTKECSEYTGKPGSFCTIASSNFDAIPVASKVVYEQAMTSAGGLDTDIVITTPGGEKVNGHVLLDGASQTGTVRLEGGSGQLGNLRADLAVALLEAPNYSWHGPYSNE